MLGYYYTQRLKHAIRFRTKRGFGVHSPYMFNLITNVLRERRKSAHLYPAESRRLGHRDSKLLRLTLRLNDFLKPSDIYAAGKRTEMLKRYIGSARIHEDAAEIDQCSFIWLDVCGIKNRELLPKLCAWAADSSSHRSILITDINRNRYQRQIWRALGYKATVKVEMMWCGILIFDPKLQNGSYHMLP